MTAVQGKYLSLPALAATLLAIALFVGAGVLLADIDTDITRYLPRKDPVIRDAGYIFRHHPVQDQMIIDIAVPEADPDRLAEYGTFVEQRLRESGLFRQVGMNAFRNLMPDLMGYITANLPILFTGEQLQEQIAPLLSPERVRQRMTEIHQSLLGLSGIGQSAFIETDPLGFKNPVMARLAHLAPTMDVRFHKGKLLSPDGKHLLVVANPSVSGTDTAFARQMSALMAEIERDLADRASAAGDAVTMTPYGAYRAALDNEIIARRDVNQAILLATVGIAVLLIFAFSRPWIGLLAFLPAAAGTAAAFFVSALFYGSLSLMALGFGGAIISITIDHGIAYLLFLDRPHETRGKTASAEIRAVGLIAALTTMGAFGSLFFVDFPIFQQLGLFTALGIGFSFLFVHTVFPRIFPVMPPAVPRTLPLRKLVNRLSSAGKPGAVAAIVFGIVMLFFARPAFNVNLSDMNTVSRETAAAEHRITTVWGEGLFNRVYLMTEGETPAELRMTWDRLLETVETDLAAETLASGFVPSMIFPGPERRTENLAAWERFWTPERITAVQTALGEAAGELGFTAEAFAPFFGLLSATGEAFPTPEIPEAFFPLLGIRAHPESGGWMQFSGMTPGPAYDAESFYNRYRSRGRIFDATLFSEQLGGLLVSTFVRMMVVIGVSVTLLLFLFFLDVKLTAAALLPVLFALSATLGTLHLADHSLDIPGLMLAIIILGMGIDYSLYMVRSFQRYGGPDHPGFEVIRVAVFMASTSTLIGFGVLYFSEHSLLRSAGITAFPGIGYSLAGAFLILPPVLGMLFRPVREQALSSRDPEKRVLQRYRHREAYPRLFARFKLRFDPMFAELPQFFDQAGPVRTVLDVGCGYGVPACWMLELFPAATVFGIDPDRERVRIANLVTGERGRAEYGYAPEIPDVPEQHGQPDPVDVALVLDILHFLTDEDMDRTLHRLREQLREGGLLVIRAVIPPVRQEYSKMWRIEAFKLRMAGIRTVYRPAEEMAERIAAAGFHIEYTAPSGGNEESVWFLAKAVSSRVAR